MYTFSPNTKAESAKVNQNFADLSTGVADATDNSLQTSRNDFMVPYVATNCIWSISSGLSGAMTAGVYYVPDTLGQMRRVPIGTLSKTFTASKDTYIDLDYTATPHYVEVTNGVAAPTLSANSVRVAKVVTGASAISSITQSGTDLIGNIIYNQTPWPKHFLMAYRSTNDLVLSGGAWNDTACSTIRQIYGVSFTAGNAYVTVNRSGQYRVGFVTRINDVGGSGSTNLLARCVLRNSDNSSAGTGAGAANPISGVVGLTQSYSAEIYAQAGQRLNFQTFSTAWGWRLDGEASLSGDDKVWATKFWVSEV